MRVVGAILLGSLLLYCLESGLNWLSPISPTGSPHLGLESLAHAFTGIVFWLVCFYSLPHEEGWKLTVVESTFYVGLLAIAVDADHFLAAGSFSINAARNLTGRPFLHWTGGLLFLTFLLTFLSLITYPGWWFRELSLPFLWLVLVAWCSHQLRDSLRRGLWLWPPPSLPSIVSEGWIFKIPPTPLILIYPLCLIGLAICLLPWVFRRNNWTGDLCAPVTTFYRNKPQHFQATHLV